ncbi:MAG: FkbM family methyltransferase [Bacteroidetes bacterium]|nr:FkbM family methyltransferase [Bacteroidota bacterium]
MTNMLTYLFTPFRKKKTYIQYGYKKVSFELKDEGVIEYAQWLHPGEHGKSGRKVTQEQVDFLKKYIRKGDLVIDIGAHEGDTTMPMALATGSNGMTLAFEPNPNTFKVLQVNAGLNKDKTNITPFNFAATHEDGDFVFGSGDASYGNGGIVGFTHNQERNVRYQMKVKGKNLQKLLKENYAEHLKNLSFIKIDTEGYDKEVIKSMPEIIDVFKPYLIVECFGPSTKEERIELYDLLKNKNYSLYKMISTDIYEEAAISEQQITKDEVISKHTFNIFCIPQEKK